MSSAIHLSPDQIAIHKKLEQASDRFSNDPAMRRDPAEIDLARSLVDEGIAAKLPTQSYVSLQILVGSYDNVMRMPAHLRDFSFL